MSDEVNAGSGASAKPQAAEAQAAEARFVVLETSLRAGWVALARGDNILAQTSLDQARRHARDLAPALAELLKRQGWKPADLDGVIVSRGPGSYTGLRIGLMSAKTLAYATGCRLLGVDTFACCVRQAPNESAVVDVVADAQQDHVYVQRFERAGSEWRAVTPLAIEPFAVWKSRLTPAVWVTGPGLETFAGQLDSAVQRLPREDWLPRPESLLAEGLKRWRGGEYDDPYSLEPLYLRPSSAEVNWDRNRPKPQRST